MTDVEASQPASDLPVPAPHAKPNAWRGLLRKRWFLTTLYAGLSIAAGLVVLVVGGAEAAGVAVFVFFVVAWALEPAWHFLKKRQQQR